jgi:hypothetical protein
VELSYTLVGVVLQACRTSTAKCPSCVFTTACGGERKVQVHSGTVLRRTTRGGARAEPVASASSFVVLDSAFSERAFFTHSAEIHAVGFVSLRRIKSRSAEDILPSLVSGPITIIGQSEGSRQLPPVLRQRAEGYSSSDARPLALWAGGSRL